MLKKSLIVLCLLTSACATPEEMAAARQRQQQADADTCASYGFRARSDAFSNCMLQLEIAREQRNYYYDTSPHFTYGVGAYHYIR
jgi:hypothetical protein